MVSVEDYTMYKFDQTHGKVQSHNFWKMYTTESSLSSKLYLHNTNQFKNK